MRQLKMMILLKLALISVMGLLIFSFGNDVNSQTTTTCTNCSEMYYVCMISYGIESCVEDKIRECRMWGGDEASCENGRSGFEATCRDEAESSCTQSYNNCWLTCTINGNPAPPGSQPPPPNLSTCVLPYWTAYINPSGEIVFTLQNNEEQPSPGAFRISIDGQTVSGWVYGNFQIPQAYRDNQQHTLIADYVFGCGNSFSGIQVLNTTFTLAP